MCIPVDFCVSLSGESFLSLDGFPGKISTHVWSLIEMQLVLNKMCECSEVVVYHPEV